jgi:hypothetical protein
MEVIMPCAGLSTRFPDMRPKYLLTDYSGEMMLKKAAKNFIGKYNITVILLKEHVEKFDALRKVSEAFDGKVRTIILDFVTSGPAETVYHGLIRGNIDLDSTILIKDCDGFYDGTICEGNVIYVSKLSDNPNIRNAPAKSYTISNEQGIISTVVEKKIVSNHFCAGGYQFERAGDFINTFRSLWSTHKGEPFVSNVIDKMIADGKVFAESPVNNFIDVGTAQDWFEYNDKPTYFCDIDGTIVKSKDDYYAPTEPIEHNIRALLEKKKTGCKLIFCTARNKKYYTVTRALLDYLGFQDCELIMEVNHSRRVIINDFATTNPYPSAVAINIPRDSDKLGEYL